MKEEGEVQDKAHHCYWPLSAIIVQFIFFSTDCVIISCLVEMFLQLHGVYHHNCQMQALES